MQEINDTWFQSEVKIGELLTEAIQISSCVIQFFYLVWQYFLGTWYAYVVFIQQLILFS